MIKIGSPSQKLWGKNKKYRQIDKLILFWNRLKHKKNYLNNCQNLYNYKNQLRDSKECKREKLKNNFNYHSTYFYIRTDVTASVKSKQNNKKHRNADKVTFVSQLICTVEIRILVQKQVTSSLFILKSIFYPMKVFSTHFYTSIL